MNCPDWNVASLLSTRDRGRESKGEGVGGTEIRERECEGTSHNACTRRRTDIEGGREEGQRRKGGVDTNTCMY